MVARGRNKRKNNSNERAPPALTVEVKKVEEPPVNEEPKKTRSPYHQTRNFPQTPPDSSSEEEDCQHVETAAVELNHEILPEPPIAALKFEKPEELTIPEKMVCEEKEEPQMIPRIAASNASPLSVLHIPNPDAFEEDNFSPAVYIPADAPSVMIPPLSPVNAPSEVTTTSPNSVFCSPLIEKESGARVSEKVLFPEPSTTVQPEESEEPAPEDSEEAVRGDSDKPVPPPSDVNSPPVVKKFPIVPPLKKANWLPAPHVSEFCLPLIIEPTTLDHPWQMVSRKRRKQGISAPSAKTFTPSPEPVRTPSVSSTQGSTGNGKESKRSRRRKKRKKLRAQEKARAAEEQESKTTVIAAVEQPPPPPKDETAITQRRSNCEFLRECFHRVLPNDWWKEKTN